MDEFKRKVLINYYAELKVELLNKYNLITTTSDETLIIEEKIKEVENIILELLKLELLKEGY